MSAAAAHIVEPFTMYPNYYIDYVKPTLTGTQRDVCDVVIRMCQGWHRESASIPNSMFVSRTGRSERAIITAKGQLIDIGLLVIVRPGGGSVTSEYKLDLNYARAAHITTLECGTPTLDTPDDAIDNMDDTGGTNDIGDSSSITEGGTDIGDNDVITDVPTPQPISHDTMPPPCMTDVSSNVPPPSIVLCEPPVTNEVPTSDSILDEPPSPTHSQPPSLPASPTEINAPHYDPNKDLSIIYINKTGTEETEVDSTPTTATPDSRKQRTAAHVRYAFTKLFPGVVDNDDWPLFGWAVRDYGVDICLDKLSILAEYRRDRPITNPKGMWRMALLNDYQLPRSAVARIRARESAKAAMEESQRQSDEWSTTVANFDYDGAAVALQKLMDTLE